MKKFNAYILEHFDDGVWGASIAITEKEFNSVSELMNDCKSYDDFVISFDADNDVKIASCVDNKVLFNALNGDIMRLFAAKANLFSSYIQCMKNAVKNGDVFDGGDVGLIDSESLNRRYSFTFEV